MVTQDAAAVAQRRAGLRLTCWMTASARSSAASCSRSWPASVPPPMAATDRRIRRCSVWSLRSVMRCMQGDTKPSKTVTATSVPRRHDHADCCDDCTPAC